MMGRVDVGSAEAGVLLGRGDNDSRHHAPPHPSRLHRWMYRKKAHACGVTSRVSRCRVMSPKM